MSEEAIHKIEEILMPYALDHYDPSKAGVTGALLKGFMGGMLEELPRKLVQACSRALATLQGGISLNDLANVVFSEAGYMLGVKPFTQTGRISLNADSFYQFQGELHSWLVYLSEQGALPGRYERFIGRYFKE